LDVEGPKKWHAHYSGRVNGDSEGICRLIPSRQSRRGAEGREKERVRRRKGEGNREGGERKKRKKAEQVEAGR